MKACKNDPLLADRAVVIGRAGMDSSSRKASTKASHKLQIRAEAHHIVLKSVINGSLLADLMRTLSAVAFQLTVPLQPLNLALQPDPATYLKSNV